MSKKQPAVASDAAQTFTSQAAPSEAVVPDRQDERGGNVLTIELADLVQDSNGEIVLFNDSHLPALAVRADSRPVETGAVGSHVTAAGEDVSGYRFVAFGDGTKIYYQDSLDLLVLGTNDTLHV